MIPDREQTEVQRGFRGEKNLDQPIFQNNLDSGGRIRDREQNENERRFFFI